MEYTNEPRSAGWPYMTALFKDRENAERAYDALVDHGYDRGDVSVMMSDETRSRHYAHDEVEMGNKATEGAGIGSAIGGTVGAVLAAIVAGVSSIALPGIGLVIAGPIAAALAGAGAGGLTGGLLGGLIGAGIPEERARHYDEGIRNGGVVLGVRPRTPEDANYIADKWEKYDGQQIHR